eukprot:13396792-Ditylum_brightwellii.AAC.1
MCLGAHHNPWQAIKRAKKEENGEPGVLSLVVYYDDNQPTINPTVVDGLAIQSEGAKTDGLKSNILWRVPQSSA